MIAQGTGNFANDDATDWVYDLTESGGIDVLTEAFSAIEGNDYPDLTDACISLAAAEVVAAAKGKPSGDLPNEINRWVEDHDKPEAIKKLDKRAAKSVKKVQMKSELHDQ